MQDTKPPLEDQGSIYDSNGMRPPQKLPVSIIVGGETVACTTIPEVYAAHYRKQMLDRDDPPMLTTKQIEHRTQMAQALRFGDFAQTRGKLRSEDQTVVDGHKVITVCAMGVGMELFNDYFAMLEDGYAYEDVNENKWLVKNLRWDEENEGYVWGIVYDRHGEVVHDEWFTAEGGLPIFVEWWYGITPQEQNTIIDLNDRYGASFSEAADWLEQRTKERTPA